MCICCSRHIDGRRSIPSLEIWFFLRMLGDLIERPHRPQQKWFPFRSCQSLVHQTGRAMDPMPAVSPDAVSCIADFDAAYFREESHATHGPLRDATLASLTVVKINVGRKTGSARDRARRDHPYPAEPLIRSAQSIDPRLSATSVWTLFSPWWLTCRLDASLSAARKPHGAQGRRTICSYPRPECEQRLSKTRASQGVR